MVNNLSVLYVEDDDIIRESFEEILKKYFSKVIATNNGKKALELYYIHKPHVAILDISIPHLSGLNLASKIRESDSEINIIIVTAFDDKEKLLHALNLQLFAFLLKPVQLPKFNAILKKLFAKVENDSILYLDDDFIWNINKKKLFYKKENIKLTNNERLILTLLCTYPNKYFTAYDIAIEILKNHNIDNIQSNNIVQVLSRFKKKTIKEFNNETFFIENSYGAGYKVLLKN